MSDCEFEEIDGCYGSYDCAGCASAPTPPLALPVPEPEEEEFIKRPIADENIGFGAYLVFSKDYYDPIEVGEIEDMILRVVQAWNKTREFRLAHPEEYGITVN
jgi:hypothetical protein